VDEGTWSQLTATARKLNVPIPEAR
jgi:hypothetical protein